MRRSVIFCDFDFVDDSVAECAPMVTPTLTVYVEYNKGARRKSVIFQTVYWNMSEDRCCCGACHVKTGAWIVAIAQFVFGAVDLVNGIVHLAKIKAGKEYALAR